MWAVTIQSPGGLHRTKHQNGTRADVLPSYLFESDSGLLPLDWDYTISSPGSQVFGFGLELHHGLSWVSSFPTAGGGVSQPS